MFMKIKFLQDIAGSIDGSNVIHYKKDQDYQVNDIEINSYLANAWIKKGIAQEVVAVDEVEEDSELETVEEKAVDEVEEDKSIKKSPENKSVKKTKKRKNINSKK